MKDLAEKAGRATSNLSRTLRTMERYGLVRFEKRGGRQFAPRVPYTDIVLGLPLKTSGSKRVAPIRLRHPSVMMSTAKLSHLD